jgi:NCS1 family nucleobase:cation symporter-1
MMAFGAFAAALAPGSFNGGSTSFAIGLGPAGTRWIFAAVIALGVIAVNVLNLYGAFMSFTTTVTAIKPFRVRPAVRIAIVLTIGVAGTALAIVGRNSFMTAYENFILFLTYLLVPWTAINLIDFYAIRKEH